MSVGLIAENIYRSFKGREVLRGASLELKPASIAGLIGPSGGGKSVLLKIIGSVLRSQSGSVSYSSNENCRISLMFQEGALFDSLNVFDNVAFPLVNGRVPAVNLPRKTREMVCDKVSDVLGRVGLCQAASKMPAQLSGGMRRRVSLARALVARPDIVLLDDPTSGLDPVASSVIMNLIVEMHKEYKPTLLMVSHDLRRLLPVVDTIFALFDGQISFAGNLSELKLCRNAMLRAFAACRYDLDA
jgi:phospholipid/cholesterol/gamma-HCH transport system ATP-binding protein